MKKNSTQHLLTRKELQKIAISEGLKLDKRWSKKTILEELDLAGINPRLVELSSVPEGKQEDIPEIEEEIVEEIVEEIQEEIPKIEEKDINITPTIPVASKVKLSRITIKNMSNSRYEISGFSIKPSETLEIPTEYLNNPKFMKRINYHIDIKKFKRVK